MLNVSYRKTLAFLLAICLGLGLLGPAPLMAEGAPGSTEPAQEEAVDVPLYQVLFYLQDGQVLLEAFVPQGRSLKELQEQDASAFYPLRQLKPLWQEGLVFVHWYQVNGLLQGKAEEPYALRLPVTGPLKLMAYHVAEDNTAEPVVEEPVVEEPVVEEPVVEEPVVEEPVVEEPVVEEPVVEEPVVAEPVAEEPVAEEPVVEEPVVEEPVVAEPVDEEPVAEEHVVEEPVVEEPVVEEPVVEEPVVAEPVVEEPVVEEPVVEEPVAEEPVVEEPVVEEPVAEEPVVAEPVVEEPVVEEPVVEEPVVEEPVAEEPVVEEPVVEEPVVEEPVVEEPVAEEPVVEEPVVEEPVAEEPVVEEPVVEEPVVEEPVAQEESEVHFDAPGEEQDLSEEPQEHLEAEEISQEVTTAEDEEPQAEESPQGSEEPAQNQPQSAIVVPAGSLSIGSTQLFLYAAPDLNAQTLAKLSPASLVQVLDKDAFFALVRLEDGTTGYLPLINLIIQEEQAQHQLSIRIWYLDEPETVRDGDVLTMQGLLLGFDHLDYDYYTAWQSCDLDENRIPTGNWSDIEGADSLQYTFTVSPDTAFKAWRLVAYANLPEAGGQTP